VALVAYRLLSALNALLEHANLRVWPAVDRTLSLVWVTPNMHKIHHSRERIETNSNYGNLLSIHHRFFRTFTDTRRASSVQYGLDDTDPRAIQSMSELLTMRVHSRPATRRPAPMLAVFILLGAAVAFSLAWVQGSRGTSATPVSQKQPTVLFICPHGAAKSVLASAYFQRLSKERGLNVRVEAAGIEPQEAVSTVVKEHLERNGYAVPVTKPRAVTKEDLDQADVVISLGCDVSRLPDTPRNLRTWDEVPGPSEDFKGADEAIRNRVMALVEELLLRQKK
jgi:protein-tyrosine-phosphatase